MILNCIEYGTYNSGAGYSCNTCSTPNNPPINSIVPAMYLYLTADLSLSAATSGKSCQPSSQNITDCVGYFMYDANTYHCGLCAYSAATPA